MTVAWNAADKSANVTLSGGNLTATTSSSTQGGVRADTSFASGKLYYEVSLGTFAGTASGFGWANATASLGSYIGFDKNGFGVFPTNATPSNIVFNNATLGNLAVGTSAGIVFGIAFDIAAKLIWFRVGGRLWNNSATADPATGTGGLSVGTINAGPYFPAFGANSSGTGITANFGATPFAFPVPSGFSSVDANTLTYEASSKFLGYAILGPPQAAVSSSKFLGYAILRSVPRYFDRRRRLDYLRK